MSKHASQIIVFMQWASLYRLCWYSNLFFRETRSGTSQLVVPSPRFLGFEWFGKGCTFHRVRLLLPIRPPHLPLESLPNSCFRQTCSVLELFERDTEIGEGTTWCEAISLRFSWTIVSAPDTAKSTVLFQAYDPSSG
jgi:hypothetical protein